MHCKITAFCSFKDTLSFHQILLYVNKCNYSFINSIHLKTKKWMNLLWVDSLWSVESNDLTQWKFSNFPSLLSYLRMAEEAKHDHGERRSEDDSENNSGECCIHGADDEVLRRDENRARPAVQRGSELQRLSWSVGGWVRRRNHCCRGHGVTDRQQRGVRVMQPSRLRVICVRAELLRRRPLQGPVTRQTHPGSQRDCGAQLCRFKNIFSKSLQEGQ